MKQSTLTTTDSRSSIAILTALRSILGKGFMVKNTVKVSATQLNTTTSRTVWMVKLEERTLDMDSILARV